MTLSPTDYKKIAANILFLGLLVWVYVTNYRTPTIERTARASKEAAELRTQVTAARDQIARTQALAAKAGTAEEVFAYFSQFMREGAPIAWFPPQIEAFFDRHGIGDVSTKLGNTVPAPDPGLAQFSVLQWTVEIPRVGFTPLGISLAALENEHPILEVRSLRIVANAENPEFQSAQIGAATILKPRE